MLKKRIFITLLHSTFSEDIVKLVNLHKRTAEERRRQTLCKKCEDNYIPKKFPQNFTFLLTDLFVKDQNTITLTEDHKKNLQIIALIVCHTQAFRRSRLSAVPLHKLSDDFQ